MPENMLIQGNNLEALKALLPYCAGQVKCVYFSPYNTGSAFERYDDYMEHSRWLEMIYPRLELLRELLSEDGSIWVSIDDNEVAGTGGHKLEGGEIQLWLRNPAALYGVKNSIMAPGYDVDA